MPRSQYVRALWTVLLVVGCGPASHGSDDEHILIQYKGSDTLLAIAQAWTERYASLHPEVSVAVTGGGSGTGIAALINGTADLINASREMTPEELSRANERGLHPVRHHIGYDAVSVLLHKDNPIERLTLDQLAGIYGEDGELEAWSQVGAEVPSCTGGEIVVVCRQTSSGTYDAFRHAVLGVGRDYRLSSRDMTSSRAVVDLVAGVPCAIGYAGMAFITPDVKVAAIGRAEGGAFVSPSIETALDGSYPLTRRLMLYTPDAPEGAVADFLEWILGDEGQRLLTERGCAPLRPDDH